MNAGYPPIDEGNTAAYGYTDIPIRTEYVWEYKGERMVRVWKRIAGKSWIGVTVVSRDESVNLK